MNPLYTVALTIGGWLAAHLFTLRAQRKQLHLKVLEEATRTITTALRDYQEWLLSAFRPTYRLLSFPAAIRAGRTVEVFAVAADFLAVFADRERQRTWAMRLEEYEVLFPITRDARVDLDRIHRAILKVMSGWHVELLRLGIGPTTADAIEALNARLSEERSLLDDQVSLLEDLRIYLQNYVLGDIAGHTIPPRVPLDASLPRLARSPNGQLGVHPTTYLDALPHDAA